MHDSITVFTHPDSSPFVALPISSRRRAAKDHGGTLVVGLGHGGVEAFAIEITFKKAASSNSYHWYYK